MHTVTPEDRAAGFKEIHVSLRDGRLLPVRVTPIAAREMFRMLDGQHETICDVISGILESGADSIRQMNPICHGEIFAVSCALAGLDSTRMQTQLESAKCVLSKIAPHQI